jgi:hypothetical protein
MGMKQNIIGFLKSVKAISEQYFMIASAVAALWGGFVVYDNWRDTNKALVSSVNSIKATQIEQMKTDSILLKNQEGIERQLTDIKGVTDSNGKYLKSLSSSYIRYISNDKALTKTDFLQYMDGLSPKNSQPLVQGSTSLGKTP